ncbi:hypothetical protein ACQSSU_19385 [Micromonospora echinospora]
MVEIDFVRSHTVLSAFTSSCDVLLERARLTLLGEATSALNPENSRLALDTARQLAAHGSVVVITHNRRRDQILVRDRGNLVQQGAHAELHRVPGVYRYLMRTSRRAHQD